MMGGMTPQDPPRHEAFVAMSEGAHRDTEETLRLLFDSLHDGVSVADPETRRLVQVNETFCAMTGYSQEELAGRDLAAIHPPDHLDSVIRAFDDAAGTKGRLIHDIPVLRKDGSVFHADIGHATVTLGGKPRCVGIFRDVTERMLIEDRLWQKSAEQDAILESITAGIALIKDWHVVWANHAAEQMFGYARGEWQGIAPELFAPTHEEFEELSREASAKFAAGGSYYAERLLRRKDGSLFYCSLSGRAVKPPDGANGSIWVFMDLSERIELAQERKLEQERFRKVADLSIKEYASFEEFLGAALLAAAEILASPYGFLSLFDDDTDHMRIVAFTPQSVSHSRIHLPQAPIRLHEESLWREVARNRTPLLVNDLATYPALQGLLPEGHIRISRLLCVPICSAGRIVALVALANKKERYAASEMRQLTLFAETLWEIGMRKRTEQELRQSREAIMTLNLELEAKIQERTAALREVSRRLIDVQEDERRHLARELHDEIGQSLTGIKLGVENLVAELPGPLKDAGYGVAASVGELLGLVRGLSLKLRPSILDDFGLLPALERFLGSVAKNTGLRIGLQCVGTPRRSERQVETTLYRVAQEAVTNVARHAGVREASARLTFGEAAICLEVEDHGQGFVLESWNPRQDSQGISGMMERVTLAGGHFSVQAEPGHGTIVTAVLPTSAGTAAGKEP
jgi:PAS domain S-box-containing protein